MIFFVHFHEITLTPNEVTFTVNIFTISLTRLLLEFLLMFLDPVDLGDGLDTDGV